MKMGNSCITFQYKLPLLEYLPSVFPSTLAEGWWRLFWSREICNLQDISIIYFKSQVYEKQNTDIQKRQLLMYNLLR